MKYYTLNVQVSEKIKDKMLSIASVTGNALDITQRSLIMNNIYKNQFVSVDTVFDPFIMMGFGDSRTWERTKKDIHSFIAVGSNWNCLFISEVFKNILSESSILQSHRFYLSKLLFKGNKFDYYVFQMANDKLSNIGFNRSKFILINSILKKKFVKDVDLLINSFDEFQEFSKEFYEKEKLILFPQKIYINGKSDVLFLYGLGINFLFSENLKIILEKNNIKGVEFVESEIEFEVIEEVI